MPWTTKIYIHFPSLIRCWTCLLEASDSPPLISNWGIGKWSWRGKIRRSLLSQPGLVSGSSTGRNLALPCDGQHHCACKVEHMQRLRVVFSWWWQAGLKLSLKQFPFLQTVKYLIGWQLFWQCSVMANSPRFKGGEEVSGTLLLLSSVCSMLHVPFQWGTGFHQTEAGDDPSSVLRFLITQWKGHKCRIGAVLSHIQQEIECPIAYACHKLNRAFGSSQVCVALSMESLCTDHTALQWLPNFRVKLHGGYSKFKSLTFHDLCGLLDQKGTRFFICFSHAAAILSHCVASYQFAPSV